MTARRVKITAGLGMLASAAALVVGLALIWLPLALVAIGSVGVVLFVGIGRWAEEELR